MARNGKLTQSIATELRFRLIQFNLMEIIMKALVKAALLATLGLSSAAALADAAGVGVVVDTTISNTASAEDSRAEVQIGYADGGGLLDGSVSGTAVVVGSNITNTASGEDSDAFVRIGVAE